MITVENQQRAALSDFSNRFQDVIKLIPNGLDWVNWALPFTNPSFAAESEGEFLENIQAGLHGTPLLSLNDLGLQIAVSRLFKMEDRDYDSLIQAVSQGRVTGLVERMLNRDGVLTEKSLGALDEKLEQVGLQGTSLLQTTSLGERIILYDRVTGVPPEEWLADDQALKAGKFALAVSQSAQEVGAALSFFCFAAKKVGEGGIDQIERAWERLSNAAFGFLSCPIVPTGASDELLITLLRRWIGQGRLLGFPTIGDAVVNIARYSGVNLSQDSVDAKSVEQYILNAQRLLQGSIPVSRPCQDGMMRWLDFQTPNASARAILDADACLSLFEFQEAHTGSAA
jgi:hypothetical protein